MSNRYDNRRGGREFNRGFADDRDRERLQRALNRPGFGRMGDDRDYLGGDEGEYYEDHGRHGYGNAGYGARGAGGRGDVRGGHTPYDAGDESGYVPGMESEYARNRVAGGYGRGRGTRSGAGGDYRGREGRWRDADAGLAGSGAELGDPGTFGSGNHYIGDDYGTRDPRGQQGGRFGGYQGDRDDAGGAGAFGSMRGRGADMRRGHDERGMMERAADEVRSWFGGDDDRRHASGGSGRGYAGRGPKGYRRSDDRIREDVSDRLTDDDYVDASDIDVAVENGVVTLSGTAEDRWSKRRAEEIAERAPGVTDVLNQIRVRRDDRGLTASPAGDTRTI